MQKFKNFAPEFDEDKKSLHRVITLESIPTTRLVTNTKYTEY